MSHQAAIAANLSTYDQEYADEYDKWDATQVLSVSFLDLLLGFDPSQPRKTLEQSERIAGGALQDKFPQIEAPDVARYRSHPSAIFKPGIKMLDFACGTGIMEERLAPYLGSKATEIDGIDINPLLLQKFDDRGQELAKENILMKSYLYDIIDPKVAPELQRFEGQYDVITCTIAYHHIENYRDVTKKLATFLKPGGWLFIIDFYNEDVEKPVANQGAVRHMGGLKIANMNDTLGNHAQLTHVSSARETKVAIWQRKRFIEHHLPQDVIDKLNRGELPKRTESASEKDAYLVEVSLIMAVGQRGY